MEGNIDFGTTNLFSSFDFGQKLIKTVNSLGLDCFFFFLDWEFIISKHF